MTSTELDIHGGSALVIDEHQDFWTERQTAALQQLMPNSRPSNGDLAVFFHQCQRTGLDPFAKQIYLIERQGKQTIQTGIDGFRLIARRSTDRTNGTFGYEDTLWCGPDGEWRDVWLSSQPPAAAKCVVIRDGARYSAVALYTEYVGKKSGGSPNAMWSGKPAGMLAKCAEALALRKAFPQDLSGLYTSDEMDQANVIDEEGNHVAGPSATVRQESRPRQSQQGGAAAMRDRLANAPSEPVQPTKEEIDAEVNRFLKGIETATDGDTLRSIYEGAGKFAEPDRGNIQQLATAKAEELGLVQAQAAA